MNLIVILLALAGAFSIGCAFYRNRVFWRNARLW